jgi:phosphate-selective porin O/P
MRTGVGRPRRRRSIEGWGLAIGLLVAMPAAAQNAPGEAPPDRPAAPAGPSSNQAIQQEIDELKQRIQALEQQLAASEQAPPAKPSLEAQSVSAKNGSRLLVSGFAQIRFTNVGAQNGDRPPGNVTDFQVTRFRPRLTYQLDPKHFQAVLLMNATTRGNNAASFTARDAYLEYDNSGPIGYSMRAGQQKIPYGYETFREGDEVRFALERARIFTTLFPDERDIGFTVATAPRSPRAPVLSLGVVNGDGINKTDADKPKSFAANAIVPLGSHNVVGGSVYSGTSTATVGGKLVSQVKNAYGVEHRLSVGRFNTQLEYLWSRAFGADVNGGYGQILYNTGQPGNLFARQDVFDPNTHAAHDYWSRTTLGWSKDFTRQFRLTLEYDLVTNRALPHPHPNTFGIQTQANF